jgi:hypothetical protein
MHVRREVHREPIDARPAIQMQSDMNHLLLLTSANQTIRGYHIMQRACAAATACIAEREAICFFRTALTSGMSPWNTHLEAQTTCFGFNCTLIRVTKSETVAYHKTSTFQAATEPLFLRLKAIGYTI